MLRETEATHAAEPTARRPASRHGFSSGPGSTNKRMIAMIDYQSTLLGRTEVAEGTMAFQFEKPKHFVFKAGQYIDLTLSGSQPGLPSGLTHTFSIASSPYD